MPRYTTPIQRKVSEEEAKQMLEKCNSSEEQTFLAICYATGARTSEIMELTKEKFKITDQAIAITLNTKKLRIDAQKFEAIQDRVLTFGREPLNIFLELIVAQAQQLHPGDRILPYSSRWGQLLANRLGNAVIGAPLAPYHFRHTAITNQAGQGKTLDQLMYFKGAKNPKSAMKYLHARPYQIRMGET